MENLSYSERLKDVRHFFKMNQAEFASFTNVLRSAVSEFESGKREPTREFIETLSDKGISIDWFVSGVGSMLKPEKRLNDEKILQEKARNTASIDTLKKGYGIPLVIDGDSDFAGGIVIPLLENGASAGYGMELGEDDTPARYVRVPQFLAKYPHLASLPVKGDSMEPTLHDGDLVVCDGGGWDGDGIYVLKTHDTAYVKRVQMTSQGYEVISDNKMYKSIMESIESLSIVGKVRAILIIVPGRRGGV
jgi:phage repressor protein C with HTH and peptisase S24 domain